MGDKVPTLLGAVKLLAEAGGVGAVLSFLFERFKWFQNLKSEARWWTIFGLSIGLPILSQVALQYVPVDVWAFLEPYWRSAAFGFLAFSATQIAHLVTKRLEASRNGKS